MDFLIHLEFAYKEYLSISKNQPVNIYQNKY